MICFLVIIYIKTIRIIGYTFYINLQLFYFILFYLVVVDNSIIKRGNLNFGSLYKKTSQYKFIYKTLSNLQRIDQ